MMDNVYILYTIFFYDGQCDILYTIFFMMDNVYTVSYTHLDVYKRQLIEFMERGTTINSEVYCGTLEKLQRAIQTSDAVS